LNDFSEKVNDIFQAAIERAEHERAGYLDEVCNGNESLRSEVQSLLNSYQPAASEQSPVEALAEVTVNSKAFNLAPGEQIGSYKIVRKIGEGGMGEVYLAEESKLKRQVALKFLSAQVTQNDEQLARFVREAQAVSALNHPNILTVYEIGVENEVHFIATEFIDGHTLRETLGSDELTFEKLLSIAVQAAEALTTAHEAGIIHRDIKPENIMIRRDGYAKILDFGLAKLTETPGRGADLEAETQKLLKTDPGLIMGTAMYMSPEQTRGLADVDARTDIWSLGVVLFEMFGGRAPFEGNTVSDMIASILKTETPPLSEFVKDCPPELERIVTKALRKDRDERYQSMKDLALDLKSLRGDWATSSKIERVAANKEQKQTAVIPQLTAAATAKTFSLGGVLLIVLGVALVSGGLWWFLGKNANEAAALKNTEIVNWNSSPGEVYGNGSFSPNADMIAFTSTKSGTRNIWIKQMGEGDAKQITDDEFKNEQPVWSPSGEELAFFSTRGDQPGIWRIPKLGGSPKAVVEISDASVALRRWSKSETIYYQLKNNLFAVSATGGQVRQITNFDAGKTASGISISPDEQHVAYILNDGERWSIWTASVAGGESVSLAGAETEIKNSVWHPDNNRIFYSVKVDGTFQIFMTDIYGSKPKQITPSVEKDSFVLDVSFDGEKILYASAEEKSDVWAVNPVTSKETAIASDINSELWASVSPDGKSVAYQSIKNLSQGDKLLNGAIMVKQLTSNDQPVQIAAEGGLPVWSPNGQKIAFVRLAGKKHQLGTVKATGADQKILTENAIKPVSNTLLPYNRLDESDIAWSPDGRKIAYVFEEGKIRLVGEDGTGDTALSDSNDPNFIFSCPLWSPDGRQIAYSSKSDSGKNYGIWISDPETKTAKAVLQQSLFVRLIGWTDSGKELVLASASQGPTIALQKVVSLLRANVETGAVQEFAKLNEGYLYNIHLSADRRTIAFTARQDGKDNIYVMPASGGDGKKVTENNDPWVYFSTMSWSPDGSTIFFGKQSRFSLLSMLTNFK
jgi:serine/threonine protein kinase/tricorn protease-like protein